MRVFRRRSSAPLPGWLRVQDQAMGLEQLLLEIWVVYDAPHTRVVTSRAACLKIMLNRRRVDRDANRALVRFLAHRLSIDSAQITVTAGGQAAKKTVSVLGIDPDTVVRRLSPQRDFALFLAP